MINLWQTWEANTRGARFSQFALCLQWFVQGDVLLTQYTLGPRGHVIMGFATKTAVFLPLLNTFLRNKHWISGCVLYTVVNGNRLCSAWLTSPGGRKRRRPIFAFRYWNIEFYQRGNLFFRGKTRLVLRGEGAVKRPLVKKVKKTWEVFICLYLSESGFIDNNSYEYKCIFTLSWLIKDNKVIKLIKDMLTRYAMWLQKNSELFY